MDKQRQTTAAHGISQHPTSQLKDKRTVYYDATSQNTSDGILNIMHKQNEITTTILQHQRSMSLPPRDIPIFDGDFLRYRTFIKAFEQGVEEKARSMSA